MMKTKRLIWAVFIFALVVTVLLIALEQYYVAVALIAGTVIMRHRELWSLITRRRLPPVDERVKENTGKAIRNGFIYFAVASAFLMLPFGDIAMGKIDTPHVLGILFLTAGLVYMLSYLFYDRAQPKMSGRSFKMLKTFLLLMGISVGVFIISVFLHNALYGLFDFEEPVFFTVAIFLAPLAFVVGIIGSLVVFIMGLFGGSS